MTFPDIGRISPLARRALPRVLDLNARIRAAADRRVVVLDTFPHRVTTDPRLWSTDRLHASPLGHARIAAGMADALGVPGRGLGAAAAASGASGVHAAGGGGGDGVVRGVPGPVGVAKGRGRSSGDGREAKRPDLAPVAAPERA